MADEAAILLTAAQRHRLRSLVGEELRRAHDDRRRRSWGGTVPLDVAARLAELEELADLLRDPYEEE